MVLIMLKLSIVDVSGGVMVPHYSRSVISAVKHLHRSQSTMRTDGASIHVRRARVKIWSSDDTGRLQSFERSIPNMRRLQTTSML